MSVAMASFSKVRHNRGVSGGVNRVKQKAFEKYYVRNSSSKLSCYHLKENLVGNPLFTHCPSLTLSVNLVLTPRDTLMYSTVDALQTSLNAPSLWGPYY